MRGVEAGPAVFSPKEQSALIQVRDRHQPDVFGSHDSLFAQDQQQIDILQSHFDSVVGVQSVQESNVLAYNPVYDRYKFEQISYQERPAFRRYIQKEMETGLRERMHTAESSYRYTIDANGKLRSEYFPDEPFEVVLARGMVERKRLGSKEQAREQAELDGFLAIQRVVTDESKSDIGTTFISISGPGMVAKTPYVKNFVDRYVVMEDETTGQRFLESTRFVSALSYPQYEKIIKRVKPGYFANEKGPRDAWLLAHPFGNDSEVFEQLFHTDNTAMQEEQFGYIYQTALPFINYYIDMICAQNFDPHEVALAYNAVLNVADCAKKQLAKGFIALEKVGEYGQSSTIASQVAFYGSQPVAEMGVGCGFSGGFGAGAAEATGYGGIGSFENSVAQFAKSDYMGSLEFPCPQCRHTNTRRYGQTIDVCRHCGSDSVACKPDKKEQSPARPLKEKKPEKKTKEKKSLAEHIIFFPMRREEKKAA